MNVRVTIGTLDELRRDGCLTGKAGHPADLRLLERRSGASRSTTGARTWVSRSTVGRSRAAW